MGTWSTSINGNDTAQDLKSEYQAAFFYNDVETALEKIDAYVRSMFDETDEEEWSCYYYSLADFMWKHGILTDQVRNRAIEMIDSGFGLDIWAEEGTATLNKRKKELKKFRDKLMSPQPAPKKINIKFYTSPIFEPGDLVAIQLQTADKYYIRGKRFGEDIFRACHGKYVVLRKVADSVSYTSKVEPRVRDIWPVFELYGKIFVNLPTAEDLLGVDKANVAKLPSDVWGGKNDEQFKGTFYCEGSMFYFRKRKYVVIGKDMADMPNGYNRVGIYLGSDSAIGNADLDIIDAIWE